MLQYTVAGQPRTRYRGRAVTNSVPYSGGHGFRSQPGDRFIPIEKFPEFTSFLHGVTSSTSDPTKAG
jgi:hypothetical protein